jgi:uncharacterized protein YaiL (DUF2058 family)
MPPRGDRGPKVPVTYLGVETSEVPTVVAEQLGLPKGFGLVVDYVVPDGPAAAAGVQQNDILRMFNDQILVEPDQLSKLVRSLNEGSSVSLSVLRKGAETKLIAKLAKREVAQRRERWERFMRHGENFGLGPEFQEDMKRLGEEMKNLKVQGIDETVRAAREQARAAREEARRAVEEARRQGRGMRVVTSNDNGAIKTTRIDLGKAEITYNDAQGELRIQNVDGKKTLIAKDAQGKLLFSGPVSNKEELDKVPADVRQRYEKLEQNDLRSLSPTTVTRSDNDSDNDNDEDVDLEDDGDTDTEGVDVHSISVPGAPPPFPYRRLGLNTVLI